MERIIRRLPKKPCLVIGLTNGCRRSVERRLLDSTVKELSRAVVGRVIDHRVLLVRTRSDLLDFEQFSRTPMETAPRPQASPLGNWMELTVEVPLTVSAPWTLEQLPRWLTGWRQSFGVIVLDLGPINQVNSRALGRLCDGIILMLGPSGCASSQWLLQHVAWHESAGASFLGSMVSQLAA